MSVKLTIVTTALLSKLTMQNERIDKRISNNDDTYSHGGTRPTICHKCQMQLKVGDELVLKIRGNRPRTRYHKKCAEMVNVI